MKELVPDAAEETYVAAPTEFINKTKCDVLDVPQNPLSTCPPVFVEVQNQTDEKFFVRVVQYSTLIFERYNKLPILLIIGVSTVTASFMYMTEVDSEFSFARSIPCLGWAKRCLLLSSSTLKLNEYRPDEELNPLQAIGVFNFQ
jgi:hypothetical protein